MITNSIIEEIIASNRAFIMESVAIARVSVEVAAPGKTVRFVWFRPIGGSFPKQLQ